ncbi:MAG: biosynthetic-type acetolactate synthase large subunit [Thermodesulfobacteriota bacterium]|nr:biosynthetic-type acetolactate synthase large subunit [Thermodesulfobacteriota bacterium]
MRCSGAEMIVKTLEKRRIETVSGIPGGATLPIYDALYKSSIRHVLARHEQGAGFIAQGMARSTGKTAVCLATSGPGATNLITPIADAKSDSVPLVAITGQVPVSMIGLDAFQEVDTYGLTLPVTKHNFLVRNVNNLPDVLSEAFQIAESGRPGPVVIDVPKDIQTEVVEIERWPESQSTDVPTSWNKREIDQIVGMIHKAKRPVICIGGGVIASGCAEALKKMAEKNSIPVASTLMGLGGVPPESPLFLGMIGMHGARYTNYVLEEADLLLAFGVRFDDRATGRSMDFCRRADIIHIDIDRSEIDKIKRVTLSVVGDVGEVLRDLISEIKVDRRSNWNSRITRLKAQYPFIMPKTDSLQHPINLVHHVGKIAEFDTIVTTDVGQHQMWVAQVYPFRSPRTFLTSGGLGTMGFGVPAAIGAALANSGRRVVCFSGDGSFLMNIQELATIVEQDLDVTVIIMKNDHLGLVRQQQELFYNNRIYAAEFHSAPDFATIAQGFGLSGYDLSKSRDPLKTLALALSKPGPSVIVAPIDAAANVYPMVPPGSANRVMIGG